MKFNVWLVVMLAMMPVMALFAGMSVSAGFDSGADWGVMAAIVAGIVVAGYRAGRTL
jgi:hypothetical protein